MGFMIIEGLKKVLITIVVGGMALSNAPIFLIMMLFNSNMFKFIKAILAGSTLLVLISCQVMPDHFGFHQPITLKMTVPEGPPEYKAGWHDGCRSGLTLKRFSNSSVYQDNGGVYFGNGVYQHDSVFQNGWSHGWFACVIHTGVFSQGLGGAPLQ